MNFRINDEFINFRLSFFQRFEWKVARFIESHEQLHVQLFMYNRCLNHRLIGSFSIVLQRLLQIGRLTLSEVMIDSNNKPLPVSNSLYYVYVLCFILHCINNGKFLPNLLFFPHDSNRTITGLLYLEDRQIPTRVKRVTITGVGTEGGV